MSLIRYRNTSIAFRQKLIRDSSKLVESLTMNVYEAINSRISGRAFLDKPVDPEAVKRMLLAGGRAPSGTNTQPWKVHVLTGNPLKTFCDRVVQHRRDKGAEEDPQYQYYPRKWREPYNGRRRDVGWALYSALGIERGEHEKMAAQHERNFRFFDAPVGLIFTIDDDMELGSWLDYGMFMQSIMLAARGEGLHTCPQAAWIYHQGIVRQSLNLPDEQKVVCGMAIGYLDETDPSCSFRTPRMELDEFCTFLDDKL